MEEDHHVTIYVTRVTTGPPTVIWILLFTFFAVLVPTDGMVLRKVATLTPQIFTTPNFPEPYPMYTSLTWQFEKEDYHNFIYITFNSTDLPPRDSTGHCSSDRILVFDSTAKNKTAALMEICGNETGEIKRPGMMTVSFNAYSQNKQYRGFKLILTADRLILRGVALAAIVLLLLTALIILAVCLVRMLQRQQFSQSAKSVDTSNLAQPLEFREFLWAMLPWMLHIFPIEVQGRTVVTSAAAFTFQDDVNIKPVAPTDEYVKRMPKGLNYGRRLSMVIQSPIKARLLSGEEEETGYRLQAARYRPPPPLTDYQLSLLLAGKTLPVEKHVTQDDATSKEQFPASARVIVGDADDHKARSLLPSEKLYQEYMLQPEEPQTPVRKGEGERKDEEGEDLGRGEGEGGASQKVGARRDWGRFLPWVRRQTTAERVMVGHRLKYRCRPCMPAACARPVQGSRSLDLALLDKREEDVTSGGWRLRGFPIHNVRAVSSDRSLRPVWTDRLRNMQELYPDEPQVRSPTPSPPRSTPTPPPPPPPPPPVPDAQPVDIDGRKISTSPSLQKESPTSPPKRKKPVSTLKDRAKMPKSRSKSPNARRSPGAKSSPRSSPTGRRSPGAKSSPRSSPTGRRSPGPKSPQRSSPTGRRSPGAKSSPRSSPTGRRSPGAKSPQRSSPTGRRSPGAKSPQRSSPTGRKSPGAKSSSRSPPTGRKSPAARSPHRSSPTAIKSPGAKSSPISSPTARRSPAAKSSPRSSPTGRKSPTAKSPPRSSPNGRKSPGAKSSPISSPAARKSPAAKSSPRSSPTGRNSPTAKSPPRSSPNGTRKSPAAKSPPRSSTRPIMEKGKSVESKVSDRPDQDSSLDTQQKQPVSASAQPTPLPDQSVTAPARQVQAIRGKQKAQADQPQDDQDGPVTNETTQQQGAPDLDIPGVSAVTSAATESGTSASKGKKEIGEQKVVTSPAKKEDKAKSPAKKGKDK